MRLSENLFGTGQSVFNNCSNFSTRKASRFSGRLFQNMLSASNSMLLTTSVCDDSAMTSGAATVCVFV